MERCPSCRARCDGAETCRRCGMELAGLISVEQAAESLTLRAAARLAAGDAVAARQALTQGLGLYRSPLARLLLGFSEQLMEAERKDPSGVERSPVKNQDA